MHPSGRAGQTAGHSSPFSHGLVLFGLLLGCFLASSAWAATATITVPGTFYTGNSVSIKYAVAGETLATDGATGDFVCEVTVPNGTKYSATKTSTTWANGAAEATFSFPADFAGANTSATGAYQVNAYWNLATGSPLDPATATMTAIASPTYRLTPSLFTCYTDSANTLTYTLANIPGAPSGITSDFRCEVTAPNNAVYTASKTSSVWANGGASASFAFPADFSTGANTTLTGTYRATAYWYLNNGKVWMAQVYFGVVTPAAGKIVLQPYTNGYPGIYTQVQYTATNIIGVTPGGTGTFKCDVTVPNGTVYTATKTITNWSGTSIYVVFILPADFTGANTGTPGQYKLKAYWQDGATAKLPAEAIFTVNPPPTATLTANPTAIFTGESTALTYTAANMTGVTAGATADFYVEVYAPNGQPFTLKKTSSPWTNGTASATFTFPTDFPNATTAMPGQYRAIGYWMNNNVKTYMTPMVYMFTATVPPTGRVTANPPVYFPGVVPTIQYTASYVPNVTAGATASFVCEVTLPDGRVFTATKTSTAWSGGSAYANFALPTDFAGATSQLIGVYKIKAYWLDGNTIKLPAETTYTVIPYTLRKLTATPPTITAGGTTALTFTLENVLGTVAGATSTFGCEVTAPNGTVYTATKTSSPWANYSASATFSFPADFPDASTSAIGTYKVTAYLLSGTSKYWMMSGSFMVTPQLTASLAPNNIAFTYKLDGNTVATGTAEVRCTVLTPDNKSYLCSRWVTWTNGSLIAQFTFPYQFPQAAFTARGEYKFRACWMFNGVEVAPQEFTVNWP